MKSETLKKCNCCDKGMAHNQNLTFWTLDVTRHLIDYRTVQRMAGMEQMMDGNVGLARVFMDDDVTKPVGEPEKVFICEPCSLKLGPDMWKILGFKE